MKAGTLFSGFEGVGIGMTQAGLQHAWGIEYDKRIAQVAIDNGFNTHVADLLTVDPASLPPVDFLHTSPPCPNFSAAKHNAEESELDIALADKVAEFVTVQKPKVFTLENVYGYRNSQSFVRILHTLHMNGYGLNYWYLNTADYGVPQTRKRLILIALRCGRIPQRPTATHAHESKLGGMFEKRRRWVGWREWTQPLDFGVLLPGKFHCDFAQKFKGMANVIIDNKNTRGAARKFCEPVFTITSTFRLPSVLVVGSDGQPKIATLSLLAKLQTFPDTYTLPPSNTLAMRGIGNSVPPLFAQRLYEHLTNVVQ